MDILTANDPEARSADLAAANLAQLKALFPEAFAEGKLDFDVLRQLLGDAVDDSEERYGLNWRGKRQARRLALAPSTATLRPCPEQSVNWHHTQNLMLEGDNLEVLKLLQKSYSGKVKLIYIDPPYNLGKDFIYPDNYKDGIKNYLKITGQVDANGQKLSSNTESSGRFHSNWLNMLYPRIKIARNLLREDGIIVSSIDQGELSNLQKIMDDIFGDENLFAILTRRAMHTVRNSSKDFNLHADYLLVYAKNKGWFAESPDRYIRQQADKSANYSHNDNDGRGFYKLDPLHARNYYTPYRYTFGNGVVWEPPSGRYPAYSISTLEAMDAQGKIVFNGEPKAKRYLADVQSGIPPNTILAPEYVGFNSDGTKELREVLGRDKVFSQPKPTRLIEYLLQLVGDANAIVLDFFAGSGTTGHAVMNQNAEDNGNRRCIQIQLPQPLDPKDNEHKTAVDYLDSLGKKRNIAEITKERLRRAGKKIGSENPNFTGDLGFRVFKLDSSNIRAWDPHPDDLELALLNYVDHIKADRSEADILYELILKLGIDLCAPVEIREIEDKRVYSVDHGRLIACLDRRINIEDGEALALGIAQWRRQLENAAEGMTLFRDSAFSDDVAKTNTAEILRQHGAKNIRSL